MHTSSKVWRPNTKSILLSFLLILGIFFGQGETVTSTVPKIRDGFSVYIIKPISDRQILPSTDIINGTGANAINLQACRGEYEPASIVIESTREDLSDVEVMMSELSGPNGVIPKAAINVRVVKVWYQGGTAWTDVVQNRTPVLVPELLLYNDDLVSVDFSGKNNYIVLPSSERKWISEPIDRGHPLMPTLKEFPVADSDHLLPFRLSKGEKKQVWITVKVPKAAASGVYKGVITISNKGDRLADVPIILNVLPFDLLQPRIEYSIYYRGQLNELRPTISSEFKSAVQMKAELVNMLEHGVANPTIYQTYSTDTSLYRVLKMRVDVGINNQTLYYLGFNTGSPVTGDSLTALKQKVRGVVNVAKGMGAKDIYFYGVEEVRGEKLLAQKQGWQAVHDSAGRVFVAGYDGTFETIGDLLDLYIAKDLKTEKVEMVHKAGKKIFIHKPQVGIENPLLYRKSYGFALWASGYDGAMPYAYQHGFGFIWNDFDNPKYRDHCFTYPTMNGVIDTIAWEGFREGVDDVRYITTLEDLLSRTGSGNPVANEARDYLNKLPSRTNEDPDVLRSEIINLILRLMKSRI